MSAETVVLDASVGALWFCGAPASAEALALLEDVAIGRLDIVVPAHFVDQVLGVVKRDFGPGGVVPAWESLVDLNLGVVGLSADIVGEAARQSGALGCPFADALSPALAALLGAPLVSANPRAHAAFPGVRLLQSP
jgi:predicted nucleic acid-binding protein